LGGGEDIERKGVSFPVPCFVNEFLSYLFSVLFSPHLVHVGKSEKNEKSKRSKDKDRKRSKEKKECKEETQK
jgi:hypothetical protein